MAIAFLDWALPEKIVIYNGEVWNVRGVYDINNGPMIALQRGGVVEFFIFENVLENGIFCPSVEVADREINGTEAVS